MRNKTLQILLMILTVLALVFRAGLPASMRSTIICLL